MKRNILVILILGLSLSLSAQTDSTQKKVSPPADSTYGFSDSTLFLSIRNINEGLDALGDNISAKQSQYFLFVMNRIVAINQAKWIEEQKKKKK